MQHNNEKRKQIQRIREQTKINEDRYNRKQREVYQEYNNQNQHLVQQAKMDERQKYILKKQ